MTAPAEAAPRSLLYVPADNPRFLCGAAGRGADWVILDLEDGVAPGVRDGARDGLATWVPRIFASGTPVAVRIDSDRARREGDAHAAIAAGAVALVVPKASAEALRVVGDAIASAGGKAPGILAIVEDAAGLMDLRAIAAAPGLWGLMVGSEDMALSLGAEPLPDVLHLPKLLVHYAARARGLWSFGLMRSIADWADSQAISEAAVAARRMGFDGATCVHPAAVQAINQGFLPTAADVMAARRIVEAAQGREGAFALDGRMVDAPVVIRARHVLARATSKLEGDRGRQ
jgi:citrate lyase subunit beta/citryl-CoA lyase